MAISTLSCQRPLCSPVLYDNQCTNPAIIVRLHDQGSSMIYDSKRAIDKLSKVNMWHKPHNQMGPSPRKNDSSLRLYLDAILNYGIRITLHIIFLVALQHKGKCRTHVWGLYRTIS